MINVGTIVRRTHSIHEWQIGTIGEVVETTGRGRVRVLWTKQPREDGSYKRISIRMWVSLTEITEHKPKPQEGEA